MARAQDPPVPDAAVPQRHELLHTDQFTVYLLDLAPGQATPMHRHDLDIVSVFPTDTRTISTFGSQPPHPDHLTPGSVRFRSAGFTHATANPDTSHFLSVIVAFARSQGLPDSTGSRSPSDCAGLDPSSCAAATPLFCLRDACVLDVTVPSGGTWAGNAAVLFIPVTPSRWSHSTTPARLLALGTAIYDPGPDWSWVNADRSPARAIILRARP